MNRSKYILSNYTLRDHNGVFKVISFPRHKGHFHISPQGQLSFLSSIAFGKYLTFSNSISFFDDWFEVNTGTLVSLSKFNQFIGLGISIKGNEILTLCHIIFDSDLICINILYHPISFCIDQHSGVRGNLSFQSRSNNG